LDDVVQRLGNKTHMAWCFLKQVRHRAFVNFRKRLEVIRGHPAVNFFSVRIPIGFIHFSTIAAIIIACGRLVNLNPHPLDSLTQLLSEVQELALVELTSRIHKSKLTRFLRQIKIAWRNLI
jgi:hypothetical protein